MHKTVYNLHPPALANAMSGVALILWLGALSAGGSAPWADGNQPFWGPAQPMRSTISRVDKRIGKTCENHPGKPSLRTEYWNSSIIIVHDRNAQAFLERFGPGFFGVRQIGLSWIVLKCPQVAWGLTVAHASRESPASTTPAALAWAVVPRASPTADTVVMQGIQTARRRLRPLDRAELRFCNTAGVYEGVGYGSLREA